MKKQHTVLICDDNIAVHKSISTYLEEEGIEVLSAYDGMSALEMLRENTVDLMILDVMLPDTSGMQICREIRKTSELPIIMLSAKDNEIDRILGLELGADDYVGKPFSPREVSIRVHKILRRFGKQQDTKKLSIAELTVYPERYEAYIGQNQLDLTPKEVNLLSYLVYNAGKVLSREAIL